MDCQTCCFLAGGRVLLRGMAFYLLASKARFLVCQLLVVMDVQIWGGKFSGHMHGYIRQVHTHMRVHGPRLVPGKAPQ